MNLLREWRAWANRPATWPWLMQHEVRLAWRGLGFKRASVWPYVLVIGWLCVHAIAVLWLLGVDKAAELGHHIPPKVIPYLGIVFWVTFSLILSQTLAHSVSAFFTRNDFDLLLSSPIPSRTVLAVRSVGVGAMAMLLPILLLIPFAHAGLITGHWSLLTIYPATVALCLGTAALGVAITMFTVRLIGARRAKTAIQVMGAIIGASLFLVTQLGNVLGHKETRALGDWFTRQRSEGGILDSDSPLWWGARAFLGEWVIALGFLLLSLIVFLLVVRMTHRRFVEGTQEAEARATVKAVVKPTTRAVWLANSLGATVLRKEWRLILRDPQLISQTLLQLLYLTPMLFLGFRQGAETNFGFLIGGLVVMVAMLVGNLAWITVAAEDAPDLLGAAPVKIHRLRILKAAAAALPVLCLVAPLALFWLVTRPWTGLVFAVCAAGAAATTAVCYVLLPRTGNRRDLNKRGQTMPLIGFLELISAFGWAALAFGLLTFRWWLILVALPLAFLSLLFAYFHGAAARRSGTFV